MSAATITHRVRSNAARLATRASVSPIRMLSYALHVTMLDHLYKPRFCRYAALDYLTDEVVAKLPKHSLSVTGAAMDPMNLIIVGTEDGIKRSFRSAGWHRANPASPVHLIYGLATVALGKNYDSGPFTPHFVNIGMQDFAFQLPTDTRSFGQRHHIRIWRTGKVFPDGKRVWVAAASFDIRLKVQPSYPFIHHAIDPSLDSERDFIARELEHAGAVRLKSVVISRPVRRQEKKQNAYGGRYFTDGKATVIEI